jgi:hypothetical protein
MAEDSSLAPGKGLTIVLLANSKGIRPLTQKLLERNEQTLRLPSACCWENFVS